MYDPVVAREGLLCVELRSVIREDVAPGTSDCVASDMASAVRGGTGCIEDAVIGDEVQGGVKVVGAPGLAESFDDGQGVAHVSPPPVVVARTLTYVQVSVKTQARDATADRILDVAERLVQTRGFHGFSYADVATELGVTRAALHYHYASKVELGAALIERYHSRFRQRLDEITAASPDAVQRLRDYAAIYRSVFADGRMCLCGMLAAEFDTLDEPLGQELLSFFDTNYSWLAAVLEAGRDFGDLRFASDARETAELMVSTLEGAMLLNRPSGNVRRFDDVIARLLAQLMA